MDEKKLKKFFSLLRQSNKNKNLLDPEAFDTLLDFLVTIENNYQFLRKARIY